MTELQTVFGDSLTTVKTDVLGMFGVAAPVALSILGIKLAIRLGIRFFTSIAS